MTRLSQRGVGKVNDSLSNEFFNRMDAQQTFAAPVTGALKLNISAHFSVRLSYASNRNMTTYSYFQRPLILRIQSEYTYILLRPGGTTMFWRA